MGKIVKQDQTENDGTEHLVPRRQRRSSALAALLLHLAPISTIPPLPFETPNQREDDRLRLQKLCDDDHRRKRIQIRGL